MAAAVLAAAPPSHADSAPGHASSCTQPGRTPIVFGDAPRVGGRRLQVEFRGLRPFARRPAAIARVRTSSDAYWVLGRGDFGLGFAAGDLDRDGVVDAGFVRDASGRLVVEVLSSADLLRRHVDVNLTRVRRLSLVVGPFSAPQPSFVGMIRDCTGDGLPDLAVDTSEVVPACDVADPSCDPYEEVEVERRYVVDGRRGAELGSVRLGGPDAPLVSR
jgi:hypothetical protein